MKFKIDENISESAKDLLVSHGHDCHSVHDEGIAGSTDERLIESCSREERHLITLDLDFADIITYPPADHHGIIVFRLSRQDAPYVNTRLSLVLVELGAIHLPGHLVIVGDSHIRYR